MLGVIDLKKKFHTTAEPSHSLPTQLLRGSPVLCLRGRGELRVEDQYGILSYSEERICIRTKEGELTVLGQELYIASMRGKELCLRGNIFAIQWE